jgi:hypothetical protein
MKKTIFNVFVAMDSQEQCDRMKAVCLENGLPIWDKTGFELLMDEINFSYHIFTEEFYVSSNIEHKTQVTEAEFLELLKEYKDGIQNN